MEVRGMLETVLGRSIDIQWEKDSNCAHLVGFKINDTRLVAKIPALLLLSGLDFQERLAQAKLINKATKSFLRLLAFYDVPLPSKYYCVLSKEGYAVHFMSDEGTDCAALVQREPEQLPAVLKAILTVLQNSLSITTPEIGIDARLSNFAFNGHGAVYFDVFPPLFVDDGHHMVHYPNPQDPKVIQLEVERKFQPFGILRRLRFDLLAVDPGWETSFFEALSVLEEPLKTEIISKFKALPDGSVATLSTEERLRLLDNILATDVDTMREVAAKLVTLRGEERQSFMQEVFVCTSLAITTDPAEHEARLARYRQLVRPYV